MSDWQDRIDYPELGVGWVRLSKSRPVGRAASSRQVDHMYVAPNGARFRSIKQATEFIESGGTLIQQKPVSSKPGGGKARASGPTLVNPMAALFGPKAAAAPAPPPKAAKKPRDPTSAGSRPLPRPRRPRSREIRPRSPRRKRRARPSWPRPRPRPSPCPPDRRCASRAARAMTRLPT